MLEILSHTCQYKIFETYLGSWGCVIAINLQIYLEASSPQQANNVVPKQPHVNYVAKNWALVMVFKALPLAHLKQQMIISVKKHKTRLSNECKIYRVFLVFSEVSPENSGKISQFFRESVSENLAKFDFFSPDLSEAPKIQIVENDWSLKHFLYAD